MSNKKKCILACDERGIPSLKSNSRTYTIGGFAIESSARAQLVSTWNTIKVNLCGNSKVELKWSHFFSGNHQQNNLNPLISTNPEEWRDQALWALNELSASSYFFPITTVVRKNKIINDSLLVNNHISTYQMFAVVVGQFSLFLKEHKCMIGEIWFDELGSKKEQNRMQENFSTLLNNVSKNNYSKDYREFVLRIKPEIKFIESSSEPMIQLADFISGAIWAASENDTLFFDELLTLYAPSKTRTYGIVLLEG